MNLIKTIWIIDDTIEDLYIAQVLLKKSYPGFSITAFQHPETALNHLILLHENQQPLPDAIILDLNMPLMSGYEFLETTTRSIISHPPVIILTSSSDENDKKKALTFSAVKQYFTKPLTRVMITEMKSILQKANVF